MNAVNLLDCVFEVPSEIKNECRNLNSLCLKEIECGYKDIGKYLLSLNISTMYRDWRLPTVEEMHSIFQKRQVINQSIMDEFIENNIDFSKTRIYWCSYYDKNSKKNKILTCGFWGIFATYDYDDSIMSHKIYYLLAVR